MDGLGPRDTHSVYEDDIDNSKAGNVNESAIRKFMSNNMVPGMSHSSGNFVLGEDPKRGLETLESKSEQVVKKRRRKAIKSCAFCRKRKLRCDQKKPMCSTCSGRGFDQCIYSTGFENEVNAVDEAETNQNGHKLEQGLTKKLVSETNIQQKPLECGEAVKTNDRLIERITELEKQFEEGGELGGSKKLITTIPVDPTNHFDTSVTSNNMTLEPVGPSVSCQSANLENGTTYVSLKWEEATKRPNANVLRDFFAVQCKQSGRRIMYGPTSMRIFIAKGQSGLLEKFRQFWTKIKAARVKFKNDTGHSMLKELQTVEEPFFESNQGSDSSLKSAVCSVLPTYEVIQSKIYTFFSERDRFDMNEVLDLSKVLKDFHQGFIPGEPSPEYNGERPIISIVPSEKKNYYKIGVIIVIISMTYYHSDIPVIIEEFLIYLSGLTTGKTFFIERVQVALLRYHYRLRYGFTGGDNSHSMLLIDDAIVSSIYMGLNHNIRLFFKHQEGSVGSLESLEKLWLWILYADCDISIQIGRPLRISDDDIHDFDLFDDNSTSFYGILKRFLVMTREMLIKVHSRDSNPPLDNYCETLIKFIEDEFSPLNQYTEQASVTKIDFQKVRILSQSLNLLIAFYSLRYLAYKEFGIGLKNGIVKATLVSFALYVNVTKYAFKLDKKFYPELLKPGYKYITPYFRQATSSLHEFPIRAITVFYSLAYDSLIFFESGLICLMKKVHTSECDLNTLRVQNQTFISFLVYFKHFLRIFNALVGPENAEFISTAKRSNVYVIGSAFEKVCRTVIEKVMECRSNAEHNWIKELKLTISDDCAYPESPIKHVDTLEEINKIQEEVNTDLTSTIKIATDSSVCLPVTGSTNIQTYNGKNDGDDDGIGARKNMNHLNSNTPVAIIERCNKNNNNNDNNNNDNNNNSGNNNTNNNNNNNNNKSAMPQTIENSILQEDIAQTISDDFWQNYNVGWQEILDSAACDNFFQDFML